ncbi:MAG: hypothetical protein P4L83_13315 [Nevskia sp.]|nr:hypothetical protein [Nevskia sp.]
MKAVIAVGTLWMFSAVRRAVTTISSIFSEPAGAVAVPADCCGTGMVGKAAFGGAAAGGSGEDALSAPGAAAATGSAGSGLSVVVGAGGAARS